MAIPVTVALTGFMGLVMLAQAVRISRLRMALKVPFGDGGDPTLMRAVRLHGNTAEHTPIFVLMVLACELSLGTTGFLILVAVTFVIARITFQIGMKYRGLQKARMAGAALTYLCQGAVSLLLIVNSWPGG